MILFNMELLILPYTVEPQSYTTKGKEGICNGNVSYFFKNLLVHKSKRGGPWVVFVFPFKQ